MKKLILIAAALMMISSLAAAQTTASGTLAVTATVNGTINLVFNSATGGVTLGSSGTNAASLSFGTVQAFGGTLATGVTRTVGTGNFTVSSPFNVNVAKANLTSANYTLKANLTTADTTNTWVVGGVTVPSGTPATITGTGTYDQDNLFTLALTIPFSSTVTSINNTINFTAQAN